MSAARFARPHAHPSWSLDTETDACLRRATGAGRTQEQMAGHLHVSVTTLKDWQRWLGLVSLHRRDAVVEVRYRHDTCSCGRAKNKRAARCRTCWREGRRTP